MSNAKRIWIIFLFGAGLTLIAAGLTPLMVAFAQDADSTSAVEATEEATEAVVVDEPADISATQETNEAASTQDAIEAVAAEAAAEGTPEPIYSIAPPPEITGDNSYCMVCHNQPWHSVTLGDGSIQNLYVNPSTISASVHGDSSEGGKLGCIDCHGEDAFPHNDPSPADSREYTLNSVSICASCHADSARDLEMGLHEEAIRAGNTEAAVCTDCHGSHDVQAVVEEPELIAGVCGDCHVSTLVEWQSSDHVDIGPLGCATCHSPHSQRLRAGETPDQLCVNCHDQTEEQFVHVQHNLSASDISCVDCHMYDAEQPHQLASEIPTTELPTGHSMLLDTTPCTSCHEQLVESGEWQTILASRGDSMSTSAEPAGETINEPTTSEAVDELDAAVNASQSYVQLLQGLILGLGFGVTFAAVFITRGNRRTAESTKTHDAEHGNGHK